ncbi:MAG TPA: PHP domain-containing protein [Candidatus Eisenbergiella merdipullorum]|uniref:PHP domain-containing protein n=1 Tax=Candidatus Eisenbergiella merdipullorum TaxID=2838553 RepID=A0A9D2KYT0_9FIRM|nr:PHP domain-containing protein [Candidatus Eisenbergiella merdipullorum]
MRIVDLHVHSNRSDGTFSPSGLVDLARKKGLSAFALTDHDTTAGLDEALAYSEGKDIEVIPGIEFSTEYKGRDIHVLGLAIDYKAPAFARQVQAFVDSRIERNRKMCANLAGAGIDISYEKLLAAFPGAVVTRAHYARYLLDNGYVKSLPEAFERYVGDHCPYFVPREKVTPVQAVELIRQAEGLPILAHPTLYHMGKEALQTLVSLLKEAGLVGIEAIYSTYSAGEEREMRQLAEKNGLLISGGSDFHGSNKPGLELATGYHGKLVIPYDIWERLKEKRSI